MAKHVSTTAFYIITLTIWGVATPETPPLDPPLIQFYNLQCGNKNHGLIDYIINFQGQMLTDSNKIPYECFDVKSDDFVQVKLAWIFLAFSLFGSFIGFVV